jgi:hypothetical protein
MIQGIFSIFSYPHQGIFSSTPKQKFNACFNKKMFILNSINYD